MAYGSHQVRVITQHLCNEGVRRALCLANNTRAVLKRELTAEELVSIREHTVTQTMASIASIAALEALVHSENTKQAGQPSTIHATCRSRASRLGKELE